MAVSVTGSKTVTVQVSPTYTTSAINTLLSTAVESLTVAQLYQIVDVLNRIGKGTAQSSTIGSILN